MHTEQVSMCHSKLAYALCTSSIEVEHASKQMARTCLQRYDIILVSFCCLLLRKQGKSSPLSVDM